MRPPRDAGNALLWRMNRRRLDAESIRDSVLAVASGRLDRQMYGPAFQDVRHRKAGALAALRIRQVRSRRSADSHRRVGLSLPRAVAAGTVHADARLCRPVADRRQARRIDHRPAGVGPAEQPLHGADGRAPGRTHQAEPFDPEGQVAAAVDAGPRALDRRRRRERKLCEFARTFGLANLCRLLVQPERVCVSSIERRAFSSSGGSENREGSSEPAACLRGPLWDDVQMAIRGHCPTPRAGEFLWEAGGGLGGICPGRRCWPQDGRCWPA